VLEVVFVLLESPSHSRRIFIGSYSLPPLWFAVSVLQSPYSLFLYYKLHHRKEIRLETKIEKAATSAWFYTKYFWSMSMFHV
jgi:hypothetical protein